jgi:hypothetical protein
LARERGFPDTAIILATGDVPPVISLPAGVVECLGKPFIRDLVLTAIRLGLE